MTLRMCAGHCGQLVSPGPRCSSCQRAHDRLYAEARPAHHALYSTTAWRRLSAEVRAGATRCTWCLRPTRKLVADHVEPLDQRPDLALERSNLVASCYGCNNRRAANAKLPDLAPIHEPTRAEDLGASLPRRRPGGHLAKVADPRRDVPPSRLSEGDVWVKRHALLRGTP